jgi:hypothetical protein
LFLSSFQISKLEAGLKETRQEYGDAECTNGMLREEVLYLEVSSLSNSLSPSLQIRLS